MCKQPTASWNNALVDPPHPDAPSRPAQPEYLPMIATGDEYFQAYGVPKQAYDTNPQIHHWFSAPSSSYDNTEHICAARSESSDKTTAIPIKAPVPLLYSQRDKAGLKAMESIAQKGARIIASFPLASNDKHPLANSATHYLTEETEEPYDYTPALKRSLSLEFDYSETLPQARPVFVVRPVTPSTMIALTEPCLMPPLDQMDDVRYLHFGSEQVPMSAQSDVRMIFGGSAPKSLKPINVWGY